MADLKEISFRQLGTVRCCLGESPLWDVQRQCLYFIDIDGKTLFSMDLETQMCNTKILPQQTGCIALCEDGSLLYAMQDGVYRETVDGFVRIHDPFVIAGERFNDGAVAPDGSFLVGTTSASGQGKLYRIAHGVVEVIFEGVGCSNGIDFSPDGTTMYYIDTPTQKVLAYDYPHMQRERLVLDIPQTLGKPDGLCVDSEGIVYVALYGGSGVLRIRDGALYAEKWDLPVKNVTCPAFCGKELDVLVVTTARETGTRMPNKPDGGVFFALGAGKGKESYRYQF